MTKLFLSHQPIYNTVCCNTVLVITRIHQGWTPNGWLYNSFSYTAYKAFYSWYNTIWIANMEINLDPKDSVIKRLWCMYTVNPLYNVGVGSQLKWLCHCFSITRWVNAAQMCQDLILVCLVCIPYFRNLDKSDETCCRTTFPNIVIKFSISSYFSGITAVKPEI